MLLNKSKIKLLMAKQELSTAELADRCGITRQRASCILNSVNVAPKTVGRIAKALEVEPEEIIED